MKLLKLVSVLFFASAMFFSCTKKSINDADSLMADKVLFQPCGDIDPLDYPKEHADDYLHEERFTGLDHVVIIDHIVTRKMVNIIIPETVGTGPEDNLCGVDCILTYGGVSDTCNDIFNWPDDSLHNYGIFNMNKRVSQKFGLNGDVYTVGIKMWKPATGKSYANGHTAERIRVTSL